MGITIFPKTPGGCGSCVEIGTGSDPLDAGSGRSIGLSVEQEGSDPSDWRSTKKKVKISDSLGGSRFLTLLQ